MSVLHRWNLLPAEPAMNEILPCCGSKAWARELVKRRPLADKAALLAASDEAWLGLTEADWMEAFHSHPRIGESPNSASNEDQLITAPQPNPDAPRPASQQNSISSAWSAQEQQKVATASSSAKAALAEANRAYERRFQRIFIVCATGKSPEQILTLLERRLHNDPQAELRETAEQQRQITHIRLNKWLMA